MSKASLKLSEGMTRVILLALQCTEDGEFPKVDIKKLAELGGWSSAASANTALCNAKKALKSATLNEGGEKDGDNNNKKTTAKAGGKKRGKSDDEATGGDEGSPVKKGRGGGRSEKAAAKEDSPMKEDEPTVKAEDAEDAMEVEALVPKKKPGRKPKATKTTAGAGNVETADEHITVRAERVADADAKAPAAKKKPGRKPKAVKAGAGGEEGADAEPAKAGPKPRGRPAKKGGRKTPSAASGDEREGAEAVVGEALHTVQEEAANGEGEIQEAVGVDGA